MTVPKINPNLLESKANILSTSLSSDLVLHGFSNVSCILSKTVSFPNKNRQANELVKFNSIALIQFDHMLIRSSCCPLYVLDKQKPENYICFKQQIHRSNKKRDTWWKKGWKLLSWVDAVLQMLSGIWLYQNIARVMSFSAFQDT